jgi:hypothetical protein
MNKIPEEYIDEMPSSVEATKESCEVAADATLYVLFLMAAELDEELTFPPIVSNGHELWKMPSPYDPPAIRTVPLLVDLNGGGDEEGGYLVHCRRNAQEFNEALDDSKPDVARDLARMSPTDSGHVWNYLNALACSVEDEDIYRPLILSDETKRIFEQMTRRI